MKKLIVLLIAGILTYFSSNVIAEVNGFAFWTGSVQRQSSDLNSSVKLGHVWLVMNEKLNNKVIGTIILAPNGPPRAGHNLQLKWKNPFPRLDSITLGRFIPPFGWDWWYYRVDRLPTIYYSKIDRQLIARDNGIQVESRFDALQLVSGVFSGHGTGGNIPIFERGKLSFYFREEYQPPRSKLRFGASQRVGPVNAIGAHAAWELRRIRLAAEAIQSKEVTEAYILVQYAFTSAVSTVIRFENLNGGNQSVVGISIKPIEDYEVKINLITSQGSSKVVSQAIVRW